MGVALVAAVAAGASLIAGVEGARAFDFFGLFGSDDAPPPVSPTTVSYSVAIDVVGGDGSIKDAVQDASSLYRLRKDPPPDGDALARRATNDFGAILDALWGLGYYNATVQISIAGAASTIVSPNVAAFGRVADSYRNRAAAPVTIRVDPGPLFRLREIQVVNGAGEVYSEDALPQRAVGLKSGDPAAASALRAAEARIVDYFRKQGRPLAKVLSIAPVVDHATETMDVTFFAAPGPVAPFGEATLDGPKTSIQPSPARISTSSRATPIRPRRSRTRAEPARNSRDRRRAHRREQDARPIRPPALRGRHRGPHALRGRRLGQIFHHQRSRRTGLLGGPQRVWRRRAASPTGRHFLRAAMVYHLRQREKLLDP